MAIISLRLSDDDSMLIKKYAELNKLNVSEFIRQAVIERIEEEYDLVAYRKAIAEYRENPVTYTHDEARKMLDLD
ncbi:MAG: ribbon-helix-helix protein, CopG family [Firmicutes bacterium]|nr:ribbon-helix-helix protein, CopG family [Bacillota bacterium]